MRTLCERNAVKNWQPVKPHLTWLARLQMINKGKSVWTVQWHRVTVDKWNPFDMWWSGKLAMFAIVNVWYVIKNDVCWFLFFLPLKDRAKCFELSGTAYSLTFDMITVIRRYEKTLVNKRQDQRKKTKTTERTPSTSNPSKAFEKLNQNNPTINWTIKNTNALDEQMLSRVTSVKCVTWVTWLTWVTGTSSRDASVSKTHLGNTSREWLLENAPSTALAEI